MRRLFIIVFALSLFLFSIFSVALAQEIQQKKSVILPKETIVEANYFAAGESVVVAGTVNGDAYLAGGNVNVTGTINGDLLAAGGVVNIQGTVSQDLRVAGGQIIISGTVNGNVTSAGGSVTISKSGHVAGSLVAGTGTLSIFGPVDKSITLGAGATQIGSTIGSDVLAGVGQLVLTPDAAVNGNLTYYSRKKAEIQTGATVSGQIQQQIPPRAPTEDFTKVKNAMGAFAVAATVFYLFSLFVIGLLLLWLLPVFARDVVNYIGDQPLTSLGVGLLFLILTPIIAILLMVTVIGIPIGIVLFIAYGLILFFSNVFVALLLGEKVLAYFKRSLTNWLTLLVGLIIYGILISIPIIGGLIKLLAVIAGAGAYLLQKRKYYRLLRNKKLI